MRNAGGGGVSGFGMSKSPIGMLKGAQHGVMPCLLVKNAAIPFARLSLWLGGLVFRMRHLVLEKADSVPILGNMRGSGAFTLRLSKDSGGIPNIVWSTEREQFRLWRLGYE